jgi:hypothetical protein
LIIKFVIPQLCVWSCGRRGQEQQEKEEGDKEEEQHEEQLESNLKKRDREEE